jgi:hypothetical protein
MGYFTPAHVDPRRFIGSRKRELREPLTFSSDVLGGDVTVPAGFIYDGPSFPLIWGGDGEASSAVHDYMYARADLYSQEEADAVLREALEAEGMNGIRRGGWWMAVRMFGANHYGKDKHENAPLFDSSPGA